MSCLIFCLGLAAIQAPDLRGALLEITALSQHYSIDHPSTRNAGIGHLPCPKQTPSRYSCASLLSPIPALSGYWPNPYQVNGKYSAMQLQPLNVTLAAVLLNSPPPSQPHHHNRWNPCLQTPSSTLITLRYHGIQSQIRTQHWRLFMAQGFERLHQGMQRPWIETNGWPECLAQL